MHHLLNDVVFLQGGKVTCSPPVCPKPDCSGKSGDVVTLKGQCCPICKGEFSLKIQVSQKFNFSALIEPICVLSRSFPKVVKPKTTSRISYFKANLITSIELYIRWCNGSFLEELI